MLAKTILNALWFILPAYFANGSALLFGGGRSIDGGAHFFDGRRFLGDGVTIRGTLLGIVAGSLIGLVQGIIGGEMVFGLLLGFMLGLGAMVGDALGSFSKRRLGLESGSPAPVLDQVGFVIFAILFAGLVTSLELGMIMILLILTPAIHLITNVVAFKIGIKDVWY